MEHLECAENCFVAKKNASMASVYSSSSYSSAQGTARRRIAPLKRACARPHLLSACEGDDCITRAQQ